MDIAALVVSIFALLIAGLAAWFAYRQTKAAEGVAGIESARREEEIGKAQAESRLMRSARPSVKAYGNPHGPRGWGDDFGLLVTNEGRATASDLTIDVTRADSGNDWDFYNRPWPHDLAAGETVQWRAHVSGSSAQKLLCTIVWSDAEGNHEDRVAVRL